MSLQSEEEARLRQIVGEEIQAHLSSVLSRWSLPDAASVVPLLEGIPPRRAAGECQGQRGSETEKDVSDVVHRLSHIQVDIGAELEAGLQYLDELVSQAEITAEKIRSILRRTEPTRESEQAGGP